MNMTSTKCPDQTCDNVFISVHDALPALNCLVEYKDKFGVISMSRIVLNTQKPFFFNWLGFGGNSLPIPKNIEYWRYVEVEKTKRDKEASNWIESLPDYGSQM